MENELSNKNHFVICKVSLTSTVCVQMHIGTKVIWTDYEVRAALFTKEEADELVRLLKLAKPSQSDSFFSVKKF